MNLALIITICLLSFIGIIFIVWSISFKYKSDLLINKFTNKCNGSLIKIDEITINHHESDEKWWSSKSYVPVYEYEIQGTKYKIKGTNGRGFKVRDSVEINYNPENPKECYIEGYSFKIWIALLILGIIFIIMALGFFFIFKLIF